MPLQLCQASTVNNDTFRIIMFYNPYFWLAMYLVLPLQLNPLYLELIAFLNDYNYLLKEDSLRIRPIVKTIVLTVFK